MRRQTAAGLAFALAGCADLTRVRTPDLWQVTASQVRRYGPTVAAPAESPSPFSWAAPFTPTRNTAPDKTRSATTPKRIQGTLTPIQYLADGSFATAAVAPEPHLKDQFLLIDLGSVQMVRRITQEHGSGAPPARYRIDAAGEHNFPYRLCYVGCGTRERSIATMHRAIPCRFLRITLLEPTEHRWTIHELTID